MAAPRDFPGPVNLGNPAEISVRKLAETVIAMTGSRSKIINQPLPEDDPRRRCPDITLATQRLGWKPDTSLDEGLRSTIEYFGGGPDYSDQRVRRLDQRVRRAQ